jgi:hypothetical protein
MWPNTAWGLVGLAGAFLLTATLLPANLVLLSRWLLVAASVFALLAIIAFGWRAFFARTGARPRR